MISTFAILAIIFGPMIPVGILSYVNESLDAIELDKPLNEENHATIVLWSLIWPVDLVYHVSNIIGTRIANRIAASKQEKLKLEALANDIISRKI